MITGKVQIIKPIDYEGLRLEAMEHLTKLSGSFWTDYNTHDPGVTIMEILCFALTELGLRANLPLNDIIAEFLNKQEAGFYPSHEILTNKPVTPNDYRKLLMDLDGVKNVWLREIEGHHSPVYIDGKNKKLALMSEVETFYHLKCKRYETVPDLASATNEEEKELKKFLNLKFKNSYVLLTRVGFSQIFEENDFLREITLEIEGKQPITIKPDGNKLIITGDNPKERIEDFYDENSHSDYAYTTKRVITDDEEHKLRAKIDSLDITDLDLLAYNFKELFEKCDFLDSLKLEFEQLHMEEGEEVKNYLKVFKDVNGVLCFSSHDEDNLVCRGYYYVDVELEEGFPKERQEEKLAEIRSRLNQNRNLCELFPVINIVEDEYVCVCFDIEVAPDANVEDVMSKVVYSLDKFISPDIHFYSLKQMKKKKYKGEERHYVVEDIFNGPLLRNGFIDDQELAAALPKEKLYASDLIQEIMDVDKVLAVKRLTMSSFHPDDNGELYPVKEEDDWELLLDVTRSTKLLIHQTVTINDDTGKDYSSKFVAHKGNLPYHVGPRRLLDNIRVLKARDLPLPFTSEDLTEIPPTGRKLDLDYYYSIRNHFPMNYALKDGELEDSASNERKAKVMQLRAFLLFFDQLLANSFKQLSKLGQLLSFEHIDHTYFTQLSESGEALKALLSIEPEAYLAKVQECTESKYLFDHRRNQFLNHILARFAEEFHDYFALAEKIYGDEAHQRLIKDKERVLRNIVPWSSERACAENIMVPDMTPMNLSGLEYRFRIFLGMAVREFQDCSYKISTTDSGAKYSLSLNQSNISLYEESGSNGNISYGFTITNTQGEFLKSNPFASESERRSAIEDFLANLELLRSSMDEEKKDSIENLLDAADHLDYSDRAQVTKIIESLLSKTDILKYSKDENRIRPLRKLLFMVRELDERAVSAKDKRKFITQLLRKNGKFAQSVDADRFEIISRVFQLHSRGGKLATNIKNLLARKAVYSHMDESEQDKLVSAIIRVLSNKKLTDDQKKDRVETLLIKAEKESFNTRENHTRFVRTELSEGKHFIAEKIQTGNTWTFRLSMELGVTIVLYSTKNFNSEYEAEIALYEAVDFLLDFHFIDKMFIIEHILLLLANSDPKQLLPVCTDSHGEKAAESDPFSFRITLVLPGETELLANMEFRRYLEKSIREATPSHIFPKICWVSDEQMIAFETAYTNWRDAYLRFARHSHSAGRLERARRDAAFSAEHLNKARAELINILNGLETIYDQAVLGSSTCTYLESDKNPLVLGQAKLGTLNGE